MSEILQIDDDFLSVVDGFESVTLQSLGGQLLDNGKFNNQTTDWVQTIVGTGAIAIEDNAVQLSVAASGFAQLNQNQDSLPNIGVLYRLTFDLYALTGSAHLSIEDSDSSTIQDIIYTSDGRHQLDFIPSPFAAGLRIIIAADSPNSSFVLDNVLLQQRTETVISKALRRNDESSEAQPTGGANVLRKSVYYLPASQTIGEPKIADVIIDTSSQKSVIDSTKKITLTDLWRCDTVQLSLNPTLAQTVTLQKATILKDPAGAEQTTYQDWISDLQVVIQPQRQQIELENRQLTDPQKQIVYLQDPVKVDHRFRFVTTDGDIYQVVGSCHAGQLDRWFEIEVIATPWPI